MTEPSEWAKERAAQIRYTLEFVCADRESKDATIAAALDEAFQRGKAACAAIDASDWRDLDDILKAERDSILARLRNPDEAMVEACLCGWNNVASGFDFSTYQQSEETREAWRRVCCALADVLEKGKTDAE